MSVGLCRNSTRTNFRPHCVRVLDWPDAVNYSNLILGSTALPAPVLYVRACAQSCSTPFPSKLLLERRIVRFSTTRCLGPSVTRADLTSMLPNRASNQCYRIFQFMNENWSYHRRPACRVSQRRLWFNCRLVQGEFLEDNWHWHRFFFQHLGFVISESFEKCIVFIHSSQATNKWHYKYSRVMGPV